MCPQRYDEEYYADNSPDAVEAKRLELLEIALDPMSIKRFEDIGIEKGFRCLEVGAGRGSLARWLSGRVGSEGSVVATDINTRFLKELNVPNIEVRQHDIVNDELGEDLYDLAHCRHVLVHLAKPEKALRRMVDALRPSGWLLIEETDGRQEAVDPSHPLAEQFNRSVKVMSDIVTSSGAIDFFFGRQILDLVEKLGLTHIGHEGRTRICRGGDPFARYMYMTSSIAENKVGPEVLAEAGYKSIEGLLDDFSFTFIDYLHFAAWGCKSQ